MTTTSQDVAVAALLVKARLDHDVDRAETLVGSHEPATVISGLVEMCVHASGEIGRAMHMPAPDVVDTIVTVVADLHPSERAPAVAGANPGSAPLPGHHALTAGEGGRKEHP